MQNCKSINIVHMVYECYFFNQLPHCIGMTALLEMMMSVLQEVKGLTNKLYFVILLVGRPVTMQTFRLNVYTVYLF